ncbi:IPT/TIG domain-containing protein [Tieghemostelium lacteum]|uniref:IPT/TIG domain-containing protein n=1 Tax=Tieghemostelium lacteum TaxID=361077 RepID=A0A152A2U9_TIELA|nr:IPT/TIG domain-containing protein [Tieghemostelium lacteum]|eukprot:KYR00583.1 IPT/TIG domain-containing protein [Tieghemostelium lacteum]
MKIQLFVILVLVYCSIVSGSIFSNPGSTTLLIASGGSPAALNKAKFSALVSPTTLFTHIGSTIYQYTFSTLLSASENVPTQSWTLSNTLIPNLQSTNILGLGVYGTNVLIVTENELVYMRLAGQSPTFQRRQFASKTTGYQFLTTIVGGNFGDSTCQVVFNIIQPAGTSYVQLLYYPVDTSYQLSGSPNRTQNLATTSPLYFLNYDGEAFEFFSAATKVYLANPFEDLGFSYFQNSANKIVGLPDASSGRIYMCSIQSNKAYLEVISYTNEGGLSTNGTYQIGNETMGCINGVYDQDIKLAIFTVYNAQNQLGIAAVDINGNAQELYWVDQETVDNGTLSAYSYPITIDNGKVFVVAPSGTIYYTQFKSFCNPDTTCSGNGVCNGAVCACNPGYDGSDCTASKVIVSSVQPTPFTLGALTFTITGTNFTNDYLFVKIGNLNCDTTEFINSTQLICTIDSSGKNLTPYSKLTVLVQYSDHKGEAQFYLFKKPTVSNITVSQDKTTFTVTGQDFYSQTFMFASINGQYLNCNFDIDTGAVDTVVCDLPQDVQSKDSVVISDTNTPPTILYTYLLGKACPNNCSSHGSCDYDTGKCTCEAEFNQTPDCSALPNSEEIPSFSIKLHTSITLTVLLLIITMLSF